MIADNPTSQFKEREKKMNMAFNGSALKDGNTAILIRTDFSELEVVRT